MGLPLLTKQQPATETTQQSAQIQWPTTQTKSNGNGYTNQNKSVGQFQGTITGLRPITSQKDPTVFAVIDIQVPGKVGKFQDFLHYNPEKDTQSMSFLVNRTKAILQSAGYEVNSDGEMDINWVQQVLTELIGKDVRFVQERVERGLDIQYI